MAVGRWMRLEISNGAWDIEWGLKHGMGLASWMRLDGRTHVFINLWRAFNATKAETREPALGQNVTLRAYITQAHCSSGYVFF
jgi:hypothetical protein